MLKNTVPQEEKIGEEQIGDECVGQCVQRRRQKISVLCCQQQRRRRKFSVLSEEEMKLLSWQDEAPEKKLFRVGVVTVKTSLRRRRKIFEVLKTVKQEAFAPQAKNIGGVERTKP